MVNVEKMIPVQLTTLEAARLLGALTVSNSELSEFILAAQADNDEDDVKYFSAIIAEQNSIIDKILSGIGQSGDSHV